MSIRIGILGYGNLGRGVECAVKHNPDLELVAVFTRRDPASVKILTASASGLRTLWYVIVMVVLYFISYTIQQRWVFASQNKTTR